MSRYGYLRPHLPPVVTGQGAGRYGDSPHKSQSVDFAPRFLVSVRPLFEEKSIASNLQAHDAYRQRSSRLATQDIQVFLVGNESRKRPSCG